MPELRAGRIAEGAACLPSEDTALRFAEEAAAWNMENAEAVGGGLGVVREAASGATPADRVRSTGGGSPGTRFTGRKKLSVELDGRTAASSGVGVPGVSRGDASGYSIRRHAFDSGAFIPPIFVPHMDFAPLLRFTTTFCKASTKSAAVWNRSDRFFASSVMITRSKSFGMSAFRLRIASGRPLSSCTNTKALVAP
jgi:hypothetical protein